MNNILIFFVGLFIGGLIILTIMCFLEINNLDDETLVKTPTKTVKKGVKKNDTKKKNKKTSLVK